MNAHIRTLLFFGVCVFPVAGLRAGRYCAET